MLSIHAGCHLINLLRNALFDYKKIIKPNTQNPIKGLRGLHLSESIWAGK